MNTVVTQAKKLLLEICREYQYRDKEIMQGIEGEKMHSLDVLRWTKKLNKNASVPLKLAAIFHDIEQIVEKNSGGGYKGDRNSKEYRKYKKVHAKKSANFTKFILKKIIKDKKVIEKIVFLIKHHDDTGKEVEKINNPELDCLVASDSFSFFSTTAQKIYDIEGEERLKDKIRFMVGKLPSQPRAMLKRHRLKNRIFNKLKNEIIEEYSKGKKD